MTADILRQRIDHQVSAMFERALPERAEEGVVDRNRAAIGIEMRIARIAYGFDIDQRIGRIARALEIDQRHFAALRFGLRLGLLHHFVELFAARPGRKIDIGDAEFRHRLGDEAFRRGVETGRNARSRHRPCKPPASV